jgi:hypothetical protein
VLPKASHVALVQHFLPKEQAVIAHLSALSTGINLWDEHIPERTLVVLSGRDILSPTDDMHKWLREHTPAQVCCTEAAVLNHACYGWMQGIVSLLNDDVHKWLREHTPAHVATHHSFQKRSTEAAWHWCVLCLV